MKILILTLLFALEAICVQAQYVHEPMRLPLPLMQKFVHISFERPKNITRTAYGVSVVCRNMYGRDTVMQLSLQEYEQYIAVVKMRMIIGYTDSVSIRALHDFVVWNNPIVSEEDGNVVLIFPHLNTVAIKTKVPRDEYLKYLDIKIKELERQRKLLEK